MYLFGVLQLVSKVTAAHLRSESLNWIHLNIKLYLLCFVMTLSHENHYSLFSNQSEIDFTDWIFPVTVESIWHLP